MSSVTSLTFKSIFKLRNLCRSAKKKVLKKKTKGGLLRKEGKKKLKGKVSSEKRKSSSIKKKNSEKRKPSPATARNIYDIIN